MSDEKIKVLIVDDSEVSRELMKHVLGNHPHIQVIGTACDGIEALEFIAKNPPDLVFTDIVMPRMNGFELTQKIMQTHPLPVIVVSGVYNREEIANGFKAIDAGAISILEKPKGIDDPKFYETAKFILDAFNVISTVRSIKRKKEASPTKQVDKRKKIPENIKAIAIGSSLGGPKALQILLSSLSASTDVPIFIVQHIVPGFVQGFVDWLAGSINLKVHLAKKGERALPGHVYIAPDKLHMEILPGNIINLVEDKTHCPYIPSVGRLFRSVANNYGKHSFGILLLGAEKDGAKDLYFMKEQGAFTIVEEGLDIKKYLEQPSDDVVQGSFEEMTHALVHMNTIPK
jgi:two-component system, chemotaxis family, protein-glutamate methylesterase/glutaminase